MTDILHFLESGVSLDVLVTDIQLFYESIRDVCFEIVINYSNPNCLLEWTPFFFSGDLSVDINEEKSSRSKGLFTFRDTL